MNNSSNNVSKSLNANTEIPTRVTRSMKRAQENSGVDESTKPSASKMPKLEKNEKKQPKSRAIKIPKIPVVKLVTKARKSTHSKGRIMQANRGKIVTAKSDAEKGIPIECKCCPGKCKWGLYWGEFEDHDHLYGRHNNPYNKLHKKGTK